MSGKEQDYRQAIRIFLDENIDTKVIREVYENDVLHPENFEEIRKNAMVHILNDNILSRVMLCLSKLEDKSVLNLTENSYVGLVLHISIAINRILNKEIIDDSRNLLEIEENDIDYQTALCIVSELEKEFEITIPKVETAYICLHLKGSKHIGIECINQKSINVEKKGMTELINRLIDAFDPHISFELKQDEEFIQGLLAHLQPTFIRLVNHMKISNPMLEGIKREYGKVYQKCIEVGKQLEEWINEPVPDEKIGFLAIHFGAAQVRLEGRREVLRRVKIGVVCVSGIGVSRLMLSKLEKNFKDRADFQTYGKNDITPFAISRNDFFVSSIFIDNPDISVVSVNPLLCDRDMEEVAKQIYHYERIPLTDEQEDEFALELEKVNQVVTKIKEIMRITRLYKVEEDIDFDTLVEKIAKSVTVYDERSRHICEDIHKREALGTPLLRMRKMGFGTICWRQIPSSLT